MTILQSHHVFEQAEFDSHSLLQLLAQEGFIEKHESANRIYQPRNGDLERVMDVEEGWRRFPAAGY
ncbi:MULTISPECIES: hypothetical protein [Stenotrophomonas]|uniref:hypothetical protein n=1 Tax=Stenotrophomonas TaxID=40323 RepID=UPI001900FE56|nr:MULTISPECIES: hypothetical protein [Stenotrophomonas]